jgi:DNA processing protein
MTPQEENWLALALVEGLGAKSMQVLLHRFGTVGALLDASPGEIGKVARLKPEVAARISRAREVDAFHIEKRLVAQEGVALVTLESGNYPVLLRETAVPPPLMYARGEFPIAQGNHLAVVGTRNFTRYGEKAARRLVEEIAAADPTAVIVSGLARGIDTIAHEQALACGLKTIAVMAGGLTGIYPPENEPLAQRIMAQGAVITEFPMTAKPIAKNFPIRNRVISGLSWGLLVVEAGLKSGALITAGFALNHNRDVFAVPGNLDLPSFQGTNRLIQTGQAKLVREGADILEELATFRKAAPRPSKPGTILTQSAAEAGVEPGSEKHRILEILQQGALHPDELSRESGLPVENLLGMLLELELSGVVYQTRESTYAIA